MDGLSTYQKWVEFLEITNCGNRENGCLNIQNIHY